MNKMAEQETVERNPATRPPSRQTRVRVSLREIRECTFRALSAHGASPGEAATAARMVVDAELQGHRGIRVVLSDLGRTRWQQQSVQITDTSHEPNAPVLLGDRRTNQLLRHVPLAVHLTAAEPGRAVFVPWDLVGIVCVDAVMLEVAEASDCPVVLVRRSEGRNTEARVARADGSLGTGTGAGVFKWAGGDIGSAAADDLGADGVWLFVPVAGNVHVPAGLTWVSAQERIDARAAAAREGRLITGEAWWALYAASRRYLVGA